MNVLKANTKIALEADNRSKNMIFLTKNIVAAFFRLRNIAMRDYQEIVTTG